MLLSVVSCNNHRTIPKNKLAKIYYEMYLTDEAISQDYKLRRMTDSLHLYEPIFNKFGYTTDDYLYSAEYYLKNPERYRKIFDKTKVLLVEKRVELEKILEFENRFNRLKSWPMLDSLDMIVKLEGPGKSFFKSAKFFFEQIDPKPTQDTRVFSLIVDHPDTDLLKADTLIRLIDSTFFNYLIQDSTDTTDASIDSVILCRFGKAYLFETPAVIAYDIASPLTADTLISDIDTVLTDSIAIMTDSIPVITDSSAVKSVSDSSLQKPVIYYSPIAEFILKDSALADNIIYKYDPKELYIAKKKTSPKNNKKEKKNENKAKKQDQVSKRNKNIGDPKNKFNLKNKQLNNPSLEDLNKKRQKR